ncbi:MAG: hypothetical protein C0432_02165 [Candidatus Puniceispirillum sp.]|nr:hypothetical protein [Candidatus Puniceispirillum sp.]
MLICFYFALANNGLYSNTPQISSKFAAIKFNKVNLHSGPGFNYPIKTFFFSIYRPIEIVANFDVWRMIRDLDGETGWVHKSTLTPKKHGLVIKDNVNLTKKPDSNSEIIAHLEKNSVVRIEKCDGRWCKASTIKQPSLENFQSYKGWIDQSSLWGVL